MGKNDGKIINNRDEKSETKKIYSTLYLITFFLAPFINLFGLVPSDFWLNQYVVGITLYL